MLGKGLESLIPQKGGQNNGQGGSGSNQNPASNNNQNHPAWKPSDVNAPATQAAEPAKVQKDLPAGSPPPMEFPILYDEKDLPEAESEPMLPSGDGVSLESRASSLEKKNESSLQPPASRFSEKKDQPLISASNDEVNKTISSPLSHSSIGVAAQNSKPVSPASSAAAAFLSDKNKPSVNASANKNPEVTPALAGSVFHIETDKIVPNPSQPRRHFDENALKDLAYSIREFGVLQPLVVTKRKKETPGGLEVEYELIAGERRLMASKLLGLKTVPAIIRNVDLEREKLELAVIENLQRENLSAIETARAFERLRDEFKMTQREIAAKLGKSREVVANTVRLLDLPTYAQDALEKGQISESNARFLLSVDDQDAQKKLFDDILTHGLTTRDVKDRVAMMEKTGKKRGRPAGKNVAVAITPELRAIQDELSSELGAPVEIEKKANTGKITITFYSEEELEGILNKLKENNR